MSDHGPLMSPQRPANQHGRQTQTHSHQLHERESGRRRRQRKPRADHPNLHVADRRCRAAGFAPYRRIFRLPGSADSTERERRTNPGHPGSPRSGHRPPPGPERGRNERGRNKECLAPAGTGRYARFMEISPNRGNFPHLRVQALLGHRVFPVQSLKFEGLPEDRSKLGSRCGQTQDSLLTLLARLPLGLAGHMAAPVGHGVNPTFIT